MTIINLKEVIRMNLKNTAENYGFIAKCFHWGTAALFACSYVTVYFRHWFTESGTSMNSIALQLHLSFGISIGVFVMLRILWRIANRQPSQEPGSKVEHFAAQIGHYALYTVIIVMVATGYMGTGLETKFFNIFYIPKFEDTALFDYFVINLLDTDFKSFEELVDFIHKDIFGSLLLWLLILGHVSAALYHHFVKKDRTMIKMTFDKTYKN